MALSPTRVSREQCSLLPPGDDPPVSPRTGGLPALPYPPGGPLAPMRCLVVLQIGGW